MAFIAYVNKNIVYCPTDDFNAALGMVKTLLRLDGEITQDEHEGKGAVGEVTVNLLYMYKPEILS